MKKDDLRNIMRNLPYPDSPDSARKMQELLIEQGIDPSTLYQKLEMSSRFVDGHMDINYPGDVVNLHTHDFHEVVYCITGGVEYLIDTERFHLNRGDILTIPAGVSHAPIIPPSLTEPYRRYVLWLSNEFSQLVLTMLLNDSPSISEVPPILHTINTSWEYLGDYFRRCVQECEERQFRWEAAAFGIATELFVQVARFWQGAQNTKSAKPELLDRITGYVEAHLAERITVADIATRFWVSQSTVSQLFRKKMGISFYRYVTMRRLRESKVLIHSGLPMDQVSISVGFQDYSSFYRAFKSEFGISPAQYRKQQ